MPAAFIVGPATIRGGVFTDSPLPSKADAETKAKELEAYKEKFANPYQAAELGFIDEIILPKQTRKRLIQALEMTENKMQTNPPKKHGNMPL